MWQPLNRMMSQWWPRPAKQPASTVHYFVHIPKCAGTAIITAISRMPKREWVILSDSPESKQQANMDLRDQIASHRRSWQRLRLIMGHDVHFQLPDLEELKPRRHVFFTFLRDPIQRYLSHYRYLVQTVADPGHPLHPVARSLVCPDGVVLSLEDYVALKQMPNLMTQYLGSAHASDLASKRWSLPQDQLWNNAQEALQRLDFIGFQDSIERDLPIVCRELGLRPRISRTNVTQGSAPVISADLSNRIARLNERDLALYRLAKEQAESRNFSFRA